jgi:iron complex outermembrane receptor protein
LFTTLGRGYYEEYKVGQDYNSYFPGYDTVPVNTDLVRQKWLKNTYYGGTFSASYEYNKFSAMVGGLISQFRGENFGKVIWAQNVADVNPNNYYYDGFSTKNDINVYAKFNYELWKKLDLYADLQYRYVSYKTSGTDDDLSTYNVNYDWNFFNPKVGVLYKIKPAHQLYASYAIAHREPNRDDILAAAADRQPKPEMLQDVEVGYKGHFKIGNKTTAALNLNYYLMDYKDQLVLTGQLNDVGNPIKTNVPSSYRTGVELNGGFNFYSKKEVESVRRKIFAINGTLTLSMNKIKAFDEYVPTYDVNYTQVDSLTLAIHHKNTNISFSPNIIASLELTAYPVKGLSISLANKYVGRQFLDNTQDESRMLNAFYYSNINISYTIALNKTGKQITFKVLLNNIFNRLYESNGYTYSERYLNGDNVSQGISPVATYNYFNPQAGFNALAGVSVRF